VAVRSPWRDDHMAVHLRRADHPVAPVDRDRPPSPDLLLQPDVRDCWGL